MAMESKKKGGHGEMKERRGTRERRKDKENLYMKPTFKGRVGAH